ncbi:MAG: hypothetical protein AAB664_00940 [Patescibacteria group bacterium]
MKLHLPACLPVLLAGKQAVKDDVNIVLIQITISNGIVDKFLLRELFHSENLIVSN